jgi:hypothetical protein
MGVQILAPPGEPPVRGKAALGDWCRAFLAKYRRAHLTDKEVFVGQGWAVEFGRFDWTLAPTDRSAAAVDRGHLHASLKATARWRLAFRPRGLEQLRASFLTFSGPLAPSPSAG